LIETTGISFTARVKELRLNCAFRHLTDLRATHLRISDIALQSGFSEQSSVQRPLWRCSERDTAERAAR
jgi:transcriptional regulator GlxA family with amidase domain